jgi:hypothetical protein
LSFSFEQRKEVGVVELKKWAYMCEICAKRREKGSIILLAVLYTGPYSNPHPPQMGRVWVENNYPLKKWGG